MNTTASFADADAEISAGAAGLHLDYLTAAELASKPAPWWQSILGVAGFEKPPSIDGHQVPVTASMTPLLNGAGLCEVWRVDEPRRHMSSGDTRKSRIHYRYCDELLFGSLIIAEDDALSEAHGLLRATETAYQEIFDLLDETGHRHLIRVWNYLPGINRETGGVERYRHFNSARHMAFRNSGRATIGTVPAACALGSPAGSPMSIYFLAARRAPKMIENPRQTSAYHYPPKFGRHSPIFSRACIWGDASNSKLFVSGTSSIVGHETIHPGDVAAQTQETLTNIDALLREANRMAGSERFTLDGLKLKVYVRKPGDLPVIRATLAAALAADSSIVYVKADICREDLLVEIEAVG
jgi:chorismate lyase / 3-hydroxybenzoate synthase